MADVPYAYTKSPVAVDRLTQEINQSSIQTALGTSGLSYDGATVTINFKVALSTADKTTLDGLVTAHAGQPLPNASPPVNARGEPIHESSLRVGKAGTKSISLLTPDLGDKTTWYQRSVQVVTETLSNPSVDLKTYVSVNPSWVNIYSPKLTYTSWQVPKRDGTYGKHADWALLVYANGTLIPGTTNIGTNPSYTVDWANGKIVFGAARAPTDVITCTYWHLNGVARASEFLLVPPAGQKYVIESVELQFSGNIGALADTVRFEIWAGKTTGAPKNADIAYFDTNGWVDALFGDPRVVGGGYGQFRADYRNMRDILNASNEGQGYISPVGELTQNVVVFPFNYIHSVQLDSAVGALFRMRTLTDTPLSAVAELATATFYLEVSPSGL